MPGVLPPSVLVNVPRTAKAGTVIEIKALASHPMESGFRVGTNGRAIPRNIITTFTCVYDGKEIFRAQFSPAIAANPYLSFFTKATASGSLTFRWVGDNGFTAEQSAEIVVE